MSVLNMSWYLVKHFQMLSHNSNLKWHIHADVKLMLLIFKNIFHISKLIHIAQQYLKTKNCYIIFHLGHFVSFTQPRYFCSFGFLFLHFDRKIIYHGLGSNFQSAHQIFQLVLSIIYILTSAGSSDGQTGYNFVGNF